MKKIYLAALAVASVSLLASCGASKQEIALQNLENEQSTLDQNAKSDKLESDGLKTDSGNLTKEATEASSESKYDNDKAQVLDAKADQDLSKAAALNSDIDKAKTATNATS